MVKKENVINGNERKRIKRNKQELNEYQMMYCINIKYNNKYTIK